MPGGWLLDVNVPTRLVATLAGFGVEAETAAARGWKQLTNGRLIEAAHSAGFSAVITRDQRFGETASQTLKRFPAISLVILTFQQAPASQFLSAFIGAWSKDAIQPIPGKVIFWP
jgi:hypothetical protein